MTVPWLVVSPHCDDAAFACGALLAGHPGSVVVTVFAGTPASDDPRLFIGGEEPLLALDLMTAGWGMAYMHDVVVHHHPSRARDADRRRRILHRNALWCARLRRPWRSALRETALLASLSRPPKKTLLARYVDKAAAWPRHLNFSHP